jgi:hypothetical protein
MRAGTSITENSIEHEKSQDKPGDLGKRGKYHKNGEAAVDLDSLVGHGKPLRKKIVAVNYRIVQTSGSEIEIRRIPPRKKPKEKGKENILEDLLVKVLSFDDKFWTKDEWSQMLGIDQTTSEKTAPLPIHWVRRILLICRAQVKAKTHLPRGKKRYFVTFPDGEVFSTQLLWPPQNGRVLKSCLTRVPEMVIFYALKDRSESEGGDLGKWLETWLRDHGATPWWLQGCDPPDPSITSDKPHSTNRNPQVNHEHKPGSSITGDKIRNFRNKLPQALSELYGSILRPTSQTKKGSPQ